MKQFLQKSFESRQEALPVDDSALLAVRKYANREFTPEEVFLGRMVLANTKIDRSHERFTKLILDRFAETIVGKSVMPGHNAQELPLGRFYAARVEAVDGHHNLVADYYASRQNARLVSDVELGVLKDVSIGAYVDDAMTCDMCELDYSGQKSADGKSCEHVAGREYDGAVCTVTRGGDVSKYEAIEGSFVWLGCLFGAETTSLAAVHLAKAAHLTGESMELKEALAEIDRLKAELAAATDKPLVDDGTAYRMHLKSEIARKASSLEKTATYQRLLQHMTTADAGSLKAIDEELTAEMLVKFPPPTHSQTNTTTDNRQQTTDSAKPFDPSRPMTIPVTAGGN